MAEALVFISADGTSTDLASLPGYRNLGSQGMEMPPFTFIEDEVYGQAGSRLRDVRVGAREVALPLLIQDAGADPLRTLLRTLTRRLNPTAGDGLLRTTMGDGTVRQLTCRYARGMEGDRTPGPSGVDWRRVVLVFRASDPYWYDTTSTQATYTVGAATTFFPFFPLVLNSDTIIGTQTVVNDGDVPAWPVWTVMGPASSVKLTNNTTGEVINLPIALAAGQSVTIDTRPFHKTVVLNDGTNVFGSLTTDSTLWALPSGTSTVTAEVPGSSSASYVALTYQRRWYGP